MPGLGSLRRFGTVAASPANARKALQAGAALLVYPGGDYEVHRPFWQRNRVDFDGRKGFIRLALQENVADRARWCRSAARRRRCSSPGARAWPGCWRSTGCFASRCSPSRSPLPWGLNIGDMLGHIPLPAKITIETLPPIDLKAEFGPDPDVDEIYDHLIRLMQDTLDALAEERRLPVIG